MATKQFLVTTWGAIVGETNNFEAVAPFGFVINESQSGLTTLGGSAITPQSGTAVPLFLIPL
jgi:hypothetical protein